ncbi:MAG: SIMPL domain-containing protein [Gemmatimonadaceae bacterium]
MHRFMLVSMLAAATPLGAQQTGQPSAGWQGPDIITSATGEARVTPDRAQVSVGVQTRAATAAQAGADNARKTRAVIDAVKAKGIPAELIVTSEYNLYPEYDHERPRQGTEAGPRVIGYVANNTVRVEVRRIDQVGTIIDAALAAGANMVNMIQFMASNSDAARHDALSQAVSRARGDAEALARAAGGSLGALLELNTQTPPVRPLMMQAMAMGRGGAMDVATPIEPGQQTLSVWVSGRWAFVPVSR